MSISWGTSASILNDFYLKSSSSNAHDSTVLEMDDFNSNICMKAIIKVINRLSDAWESGTCPKNSFEKEMHDKFGEIGMKVIDLNAFH